MKHTGGPVLANVRDRDVAYDRKSDDPHTTPAPRGVCCVCPRGSSIATKLECRDHYIVENKNKCPFLSFNLPKLHSNHPSSHSLLSVPPCNGGQYLHSYQSDHTQNRPLSYAWSRVPVRELELQFLYQKPQWLETKVL